MITFIKAQAIFILGSFADFLTTLFFVQILHSWYLAGNLFGNIAGALVQFILCRNWVFNATGKKISIQLIKFVLVWIGNLALSAAAVYLLTGFFGIHYILSKLISSVMLGLTYNYLLQKRFVFDSNA